MNDVSLQVNLGAVTSMFGKLTFSFVVHNSGSAHVQIYASDPTDLRKSGVLLTLDEAGYRELRTLLNRTDETIEKLRTAGQVRGDLIVRL